MFAGVPRPEELPLPIISTRYEDLPPYSGSEPNHTCTQIVSDGAGDSSSTRSRHVERDKLSSVYPTV